MFKLIRQNLLIALLVSYSGFLLSQGSTVCKDLGVENGWSGWQAKTGTNVAGVPSGGSFGAPTSPRFTIMSGNGVDSCTPGTGINDPAIPVVAYGFGNYSFRLGEAGVAGKGEEQIKFSFTPTAQDSNFVYTYALVSNDPIGGHSSIDETYAEFIIFDSNGDTVPCSYQRYIGKPIGNEYYLTNSNCGGYAWYKPWTTVGLNIAPYVGQMLTVRITNADCTLGGHYMKSYWDFSCGFNDVKFCAGQSVTLCAPDSTNSTPYMYSWILNGSPLVNFNQCIVTNPQPNDTFYVQIISPSGCQYYQYYVMKDSCLTNINVNNVFDQLVSIYPNPTSQSLWFDFGKNDFGDVQLVFYNIFGSVVSERTIVAFGKQEVDISDLPEGMYFIRLKTIDGVVTRKISVSR